MEIIFITLMFILTHTPTGSAYALEEGTLITTPLYEDLTFDTAIENWVEVEENADTVEFYNGITSVLFRAQVLDPEFVDKEDV